MIFVNGYIFELTKNLTAPDLLLGCITNYKRYLSNFMQIYFGFLGLVVCTVRITKNSFALMFNCIKSKGAATLLRDSRKQLNILRRV